MLKKTAAVLLSLLMCGMVFLVGCGDSQIADETESESVHEETMIEETEHPETESGRFTYSASRELDLYIDGYSNYMELAVERFTALHPEVTVNVTDCSGMTPSEFGVKVETEMRTGGGPDVVAVYNFSPVPFENITDMIRDGLLADLDEMEIDLSGCNQTVMKAGEYMGVQYLAPISYSLGLLYTTEERLDEYGIPYHDGVTLEEFAAALAEFYAENPGKKAFLNYFMLNYIYQQNGLSLIDFEENQLVDSEDNIALMERLCEIYDDLFPGIFDDTLQYMVYRNAKNYGGTDTGIYESGDVLFMSGRGFMGGFECINMYNNRLYPTDIAKKQTPIVMPLPTVDGDAPAPVVTYYAFVNSNTENESMAKMFVEMLIDTEFQIASTGCGIPANNEAIDILRDFYVDGKTYYDYNLPATCVYDKDFAQSYFELIDNMAEPSFIDTKILNGLMTVVGSYIADDMPIEEAFAAGKAQIDEYLGE